MDFKTSRHYLISNVFWASDLVNIRFVTVRIFNSCYKCRDKFLNSFIVFPGSDICHTASIVSTPVTLPDIYRTKVTSPFICWMVPSLSTTLML